MRLSIVCTTARAEPRLDWIVESLASQALPGDVLQLVVVDSLSRSREELGLAQAGPVAEVRISPPKPTPWQGPQRVTSRDWWALSSARNTGIVLCSHGYVALVDDRCRLGPRWLAAVRAGQRAPRSVLAGAYDKSEQDSAGEARIVVDHRLGVAPQGRVDCGGGWLYGCAMAMPLEWLLEVNGFEEGCDGLSGEDYILGLMLANRGRRVDYVPDLRVHQDRRTGSGHGCCRADKGTSPRDKSHAALERFGRRDRTEFTPDLRALRRTLASGGKFPDVDPRAPHLDWYDGQPIRDAVPPP